MVYNKICVFFMIALAASVLSADVPETSPKVRSESASNVRTSTVTVNANSSPTPTVAESASATEVEDGEDEEEIKKNVMGGGTTDMVSLIEDIIKDEMEDEPLEEETDTDVGTTDTDVLEDHGRYERRRRKFRKIAGKIGRVLVNNVLPNVVG